MKMLEIFAHNISVGIADDTDGVYEVHGQDWEGEKFILYLNDEEARSLLVQLGFQVYERDTP